jgi:miniconductance mechanosensitive channel
MDDAYIHKLIKSWLSQLGVSSDNDDLLIVFIYFAGAVIIAMISYHIAKYILINVLSRISKKTQTDWDDILVEKHFFRRLANLIPAGILLAFIPDIFTDYPWWISFMSNLINIFIIFTILLTIDALLNAFTDIYKDFEIAKTKPIKGYVQIIKILVYFLGTIFIVSTLIGRSAGTLLTGLGAITAILLFVFRDPILGFIGSIQLSANDMVRPDDWIVVEKHGADGVVIDMNLTSVKVQNWDMTITNIPTYTLVSDSFINWRGMQESGGRRVMRSVNIDMKSIAFSTPEMIEKFSRIRLLKEYIEEKENDIATFNKKHNINTSEIVNMRRQTNIGVFRKYLLEYLKHHPDVNQDMIIQVRQLAPTEKGLPMEIYCFSAKQAWVEYEKVQSEIFDHILTVIPEFGLKVFQNPSGEDFKNAFGRATDQDDA